MAVMTNEGVTIYAIDPQDCGCTECIIGEYVHFGFDDDKNLDLVIHAIEGDLGWNLGACPMSLTYQSAQWFLSIQDYGKTYTFNLTNWIDGKGKRIAKVAAFIDANGLRSNY